MEFFITLTYFNRKIGPMVFYSYPISITDEDLIEKIASIMDLLTSEQFVTYSFNNHHSLNYYFEIKSTWARGEIETLLISTVFQESVPIEIEKAILTLCIEFSEWLKGKENIFKGFYQHDPKFYQTHSKIIDDTSFEVKSWVEEFYRAVSEVVQEKITEESITSFIEKENVLETLKFISNGPVSLEKLREWYTKEFPESNIYKLMIDLIKNRMITIPNVGKSESPPFKVYISEDIKRIIELIDLKNRLLKRFITANQKESSEEIQKRSKELEEILEKSFL
jgi:hypothetical protein